MSEEFARWEGFPELVDLSGTAHAALFRGALRPWDALKALDTYLSDLLAEALEDNACRAPAPALREHGPGVILEPGCVVDPGARIAGNVRIGPGARVEAGACITGPAWIGADCEIRQGAYLRGFVLAADGAILGHASEFKHCILLEGAQAPHFNYVGDSIMGILSHIGAGVILSNVRLDKRKVRAWTCPPEPAPVDTGLEKFGAFIGDRCEIGCNSVLNPGTILGAGSVVGPLSRVKGSWPGGSAIG